MSQAPKENQSPLHDFLLQHFDELEAETEKNRSEFDRIIKTEALKFERLDFFIERVEKLTDFLLSPKARFLLKKSPEEAYQHLLDLIFDGTEEVRFFKQTVKLKLACLQLVDRMETIKKYHDYARFNPKLFLEKEVLWDNRRKSQIIPRGKIGTEISPFSLGFVLDEEDYKRCLNENPPSGERSSGGSTYFALKDDIENMVYFVNRDNDDPEMISSHEKLHVLYDMLIRDHLFRSEPDEKHLFDNTKREEVAHHLNIRLKNTSGHYLSVLQSELISYLTEKEPKLPLSSGQHTEAMRFDDMDSWKIEIKDLEFLSREEKDTFCKKIDEKKEELKKIGDHYQKIAATMLAFCDTSPVTKKRLMAILASTPPEKLDVHLAHYRKTYLDSIKKTAELEQDEFNEFTSDTNFLEGDGKWDKKIKLLKESPPKESIPVFLALADKCTDKAGFFYEDIWKGFCEVLIRLNQSDVDTETLLEIVNLMRKNMEDILLFADEELVKKVVSHLRLLVRKNNTKKKRQKIQPHR